MVFRCIHRTLTEQFRDSHLRLPTRKLHWNMESTSRLHGATGKDLYARQAQLMQRSEEVGRGQGGGGRGAGAKYGTYAILGRHDRSYPWFPGTTEQPLGPPYTTFRSSTEQNRFIGVAAMLPRMRGKFYLALLTLSCLRIVL